MRSLIAILILSIAAPLCTHAARAGEKKDLAPPPPGALLPVVLNQTLKPRNLQAGQPVTAELVQIVPVSAQVSLPEWTKLDGHVVNVTNTSISLLFDQLRWKGRTLPVHVRLIAGAGPYDVYQTKLPLGATDRGTSNPGDWTTEQIGGDEVYLSAGAGTVYNRYSEPVGFANFTGVYASPEAPGALPHAMGPFSTTASGLHGFPALSITSEGGVNAPFTLNSSKSNWQIRRGSAFLLEVVR
jgi:hypothetical protein